VDTIVAIYWAEGASYTGEEMVELCCHGSPARVEGVMEALLAAGCRMAERGEFTRRALLSGRMNVMEAAELAAIAGEGETALPAAPMEEQAAEARRMAGDALAALEGEIEFEEEHMTEAAGSSKRIAELEDALRALRERAAAAEGGRRVVVMGPPNSGKSSLVNRLAGREAVLVDGAAGTTRDGASVDATVGGARVLLQDTAGAAEAGLDGRAYGLAADSLRDGDMLIWMETGPSPGLPRRLSGRCSRVLRISSRADLYSGGERRLSLVTGEGLERLRSEVASWASAGSIAAGLRDVEESVRSCRRALEMGCAAMAAEELRDAEESLAAMVDGRGSNMAAAVERIMERLCIGK
jgi:tRNA modification GTPase